MSTGFNNLNSSLDFILSNADGTISTYNAANLGSEIANQIQAMTNAAYQNAVQASGSAINAVNGRVDDANNVINQLQSNFQAQIEELNSTVIRNNKTYQLRSAQQGGPNCLDGGGNNQRCNWDNEYRRFVFDETPYAPGSTVNQNNNYSTTYTDLGCWMDSQNRVFSHQIGNWAATYDVDTCGQVALNMGKNFFALQAGGQCWVGDASDDYQQYGQAAGSCPALGGSWINHVYMATY